MSGCHLFFFFGSVSGFEGRAPIKLSMRDARKRPAGWVPAGSGPRACWGCGDWPMGWAGGAEEQNGRRPGSGGAGCGEVRRALKKCPSGPSRGLTAAAEEECLNSNFHLFCVQRDKTTEAGFIHHISPVSSNINLPGPSIQRRAILPTPRWPFALQDEVGIAWPARDQSSFGLRLAFDLKRPRQTSPALPSPALQRAVLPVFTDWPLR